MAATLDDVVAAIEAMSTAVTDAISAQTIAIEAKVDSFFVDLKKDVFADPSVTPPSFFAKYFAYSLSGQSEDDKRQASTSQDPTVTKYQNLLMEFNSKKHLDKGSGSGGQGLPATDIYGWTWVYDKPPPMLSSVKKQEGAREIPIA
jgi:hypothetical protein